MLVEEIDRPSIEKLIRTFYAKVIQDDLVGPYFIRTLGDDLTSFKWYEHFSLLDNFWLGMILEEGHYRGDPFMPHVFLGEIPKEAFDRWLALFRETLEEIYTPINVLKFYGKAKGITKRFMTDLEIYHEDDD